MTRCPRKVFAYITSGRSLLLLAQPDHPEAGIQVPAGTMRPGEPVIAAALREAWEETGLADLEPVRVLGVQAFDLRPFGRDEVHRRTFVHLVCHGDSRDSWEHVELDPEGSPGERFRFRLYWASLDDPLPDLIGGHGVLLEALRASLAGRSPAPR